MVILWRVMLARVLLARVWLLVEPPRCSFLNQRKRRATKSGSTVGETGVLGRRDVQGGARMHAAPPHQPAHAHRAARHDACARAPPVAGVVGLDVVLLTGASHLSPVVMLAP